jgi:hypothetical protein
MAFKAEPCQAVSRSTGERCTQPAVKGGVYCRFHADALAADPDPEAAADTLDAAPAPDVTAVPPERDKGGQPGNNNARKHGGYSLQLQPEEEALYREKREQFTGQLGELDVFDTQVVHILALISTKLDVAAVQGAPAQVLIPISNEVLRLLRSLKETRDSRDPVDGRAPRSFADFLEELEGLEGGLGIPQSEQDERRRLYELEREVNELRLRVGLAPRGDIEHRTARCGQCRADTEQRRSRAGGFVCLACGHFAPEVVVTPPPGAAETAAAPADPAAPAVPAAPAKPRGHTNG